VQKYTVQQDQELFRTMQFSKNESTETFSSSRTRVQKYSVQQESNFSQ
jgi:hypothetical protein